MTAPTLINVVFIKPARTGFGCPVCRCRLYTLACAQLTHPRQRKGAHSPHHAKPTKRLQKRLIMSHPAARVYRHFASSGSRDRKPRRPRLFAEGVGVVRPVKGGKWRAAARRADARRLRGARTGNKQCDVRRSVQLAGLAVLPRPLDTFVNATVQDRVGIGAIRPGGAQRSRPFPRSAAALSVGRSADAVIERACSCPQREINSGNKEFWPV
jgi:hypothetical protein